jgi:esterase/lipase
MSPGIDAKRMVWLDDSYHKATLEFGREQIASEKLAFIQVHLG